MPRKILTFLAVLLLASAASAETSVSQPLYGPAPGDQLTPFIATNGSDFLVAWTDGRAGFPVAVYATRVAADGRVLDPTGIRVATTNSVLGVFRMAAAYTVLTTGIGGTMLLTRIGDDGAIVDGPRVVLDHTVSAAASNGTRIVLIDAGTLTILDDRGNVLERNVPLGAPAGFLSVVASNGSTFLVATASSPDDIVDLTALDAAGHPRLPSTRTGFPTTARPVIASDGSDYLVVFAGGPFDFVAVRAGADAQVRAQTTRVNSPGPGSLTWTGSNYLMLTASRSPQRQIEVLPVSRDGVPGDPRFLSGATTDTPSLTAIAWNGSAALASWSVGESDNTSLDLAAELLHGDGSPIGAPETIANSANAQAAPQIATGGTTDLVVWDEPSGIYAARLTREGIPVDGRGILVAEAPVGSRLFAGGIHPLPRVAFDGSAYAVVWSDAAFALHLRRIDPETGSLIGDATTIAACVQSFDIGRDDRGLVVFYAACGDQLVARRVDAAGAPGAASSITAPDVRAISPRAAWNGTEWLVVWNELVPGISPPLVGRENVFGALLTHDFAGTLLPITIEGNGFAELPPVVATNGNDFFVAWSHVEGGLYARRVAPTGTLSATQLLVAGAASAGAAVWDGTRYAVAYHLGNDLYLTHGGDTVAISTGAPDSREPSLVAQRGVVRAAYVRVATEAVYGGVGRVFVRDLEGRRRAAR